MEIKKFPDPALTKISDPVTDFGEPLRQLVEDLFVTAAAQTPGTVAGLAAPQLGVNLRVFLAQGKVFINPTVKLANGQDLGQEGCFSSPDGPTKMFKVWRRQTVWIKYQDLRGQWHEERYNGFMARVIAHELDHLNGVMCLNREEAVYGHQ